MVDNKSKAGQQNAQIVNEILNKLDALVYITDMESDEIVFINERMQREFHGQSNMVGEKCWHVLQAGVEGRCQLCPKHKLVDDPNAIVSWEEHSTVTGKYYRNTDCVIRWTDGRPVHMQHSVDINDMKQAQDVLSNYRDFLEHEVAEKVTELRRTKTNMLEALASIIEYRDVVSGQHTKRTSILTRKLIERLMEQPDYYAALAQECDIIVSAAPLHDIGKIAVPDSILLKPGKLTPEEYEQVKKHSVLGNEIIETMRESLDELYYRFCREICLYHHERWDGAGYPNGLAGEEIPLAARILAVVDVYDALVSERPYKAPFDHATALRIIAEGAGTQFDPGVAKAMLGL